MHGQSNNLPFPTIKRVAQKNFYYCGPATLVMLLDFQGVQVTQNEVVAAAGVEGRIAAHGMRIEELGAATRVLAPHLQFWYKRNATLAELSQIVNIHRYPVGIQWQGVFDYPDDVEIYEGESDDDDDPSHISIVTYLNTAENIVRIADPFAYYVGHDRRFTILEFERRWWDINTLKDPLTGKMREIDDYHMLFIVTEPYVSFPSHLGLTRA